MATGDVTSGVPSIDETGRKLSREENQDLLSGTWAPEVVLGDPDPTSRTDSPIRRLAARTNKVGKSPILNAG